MLNSTFRSISSFCSQLDLYGDGVSFSWKPPTDKRLERVGRESKLLHDNAITVNLAAMQQRRAPASAERKLVNRLGRVAVSFQHSSVTWPPNNSARHSQSALGYFQISANKLCIGDKSGVALALDASLRTGVAMPCSSFGLACGDLAPSAVPPAYQFRCLEVEVWEFVTPFDKIS